MQGIKIALPAITIDCAVLYDIKENKVLKRYEMSFAEVKEYLEIFSRKAFHCFVNVIVEDSVIIYYEEFQNPVDKKIYEPLQKLPYRNYMKGPLLEKGAPVYLVLVDIKERIEALYADLEEADYTSKNKI